MNWDEIGRRHGTDKSSLNHDYLTHYEAMLAGRDVRRVLELGIAAGASIRTWREVLPDAHVVGVDVEPRPEHAHIYGAALVYGDAGDPDVMSVHDAVYGQDLAGPFDLIVDDAQHDLVTIRRILDVFASRLAPGGVYVVEDTLVDPDADEDAWPAPARFVRGALAMRGLWVYDVVVSAEDRPEGRLAALVAVRL